MQDEWWNCRDNEWYEVVDIMNVDSILWNVDEIISIFKI